MKKRVIKNQKYENYWSLTLEYSDFYGKPFNDVLSIIVAFIDKMNAKNTEIKSKEYNELQELIEKQYPKKDSASTRKSINQFLKLGFINNAMKSYHYLTKAFLSEPDKSQKQLLYSKIVYENAAFTRSFTNYSNINEVKFLVKTLEACGTLTKNKLIALLYTDVSSVQKGFLTEQEVDNTFSKLIVDHADDRKYNQRNYLFDLCSHLTDIYVKNDVMSLNPELLIDKKETTKVRDPYLQRLYKIELINEVKKIFKFNVGKCVLEKLSYPILIASHIKPYAKCAANEQFDKNNGLLLSKNMDSLFDNGYITFDDNGNILTSSKLNSDVIDYIKQFHLDSSIYNMERKKYMEYHRKYVFLG